MKQPIRKDRASYEKIKICEYYLKQAFLKYVDAYIEWKEEKEKINNL